jgi:hypothetical protein
MHLHQVQELSRPAHGPWRSRLFNLNIRHVEQLGSLLASPEGRYALRRLKVPVEEVQAVLAPVLRDRLGFSLDRPHRASGSAPPLLTRKRHFMGHMRGDRDPFREIAFDSELPHLPRRGSARRTAASARLPAGKSTRWGTCRRTIEGPTKRRRSNAAAAPIVRAPPASRPPYSSVRT